MRTQVSGAVWLDGSACISTAIVQNIVAAALRRTDAEFIVVDWRSDSQFGKVNVRWTADLLDPP